MKAQKGDRIVLAGEQVDRPTRDGEILEVRGKDGAPPYLVRWSDGHTGLLYPGPGSVLRIGSGQGEGAAAVPTLDKAFSGALTVGGSSTLTFTVSQPAGNPAQTFSFTDTLPAGLVIASPAQTAMTSTAGLPRTSASSGPGRPTRDSAANTLACAPVMTPRTRSFDSRYAALDIPMARSLW